jgi:Zn-dependent protease with chaperone function
MVSPPPPSSPSPPPLRGRLQDRSEVPAYRISARDTLSPQEPSEFGASRLASGFGTVSSTLHVDDPSKIAQGFVVCFDGKTSRRLHAHVVVEGAELRVATDPSRRERPAPHATTAAMDTQGAAAAPATAQPSVVRYPLRELQISEPWAGAPLSVALPDGVTIWIDHERSPSLAAALIGRTRAVHRRETRIVVPDVAAMTASWPKVVAALLATIALLVWFDRQGAGVLGNAALRVVPESVDRRIGDQVEQSIRADWLSPTKGLPQRQQRIKRRFDEVAARVAPGRELKLEFHRTKSEPVRAQRQSRPEGDEEGGMTLPGRRDNERSSGREDDGGFNAFALPNGTIVLLDGMVTKLSDDEVMMVLGHELGHVVHRHGMQGVMRSLGLVTVAGVVFGDFSTIAATALATLQSFAHSRDAEREADEFGRRFAKEAGLPAGTEAQVWRKLFEAQRGAGSGEVPEWLSTHPSTQERLRAAEAAQRADEAKKP